ncbi:hypothetical protein, partial [Actinobacillus pleuropneumoniae]
PLPLAPPRQPQIPAQPNLNPNNRQASKDIVEKHHAQPMLWRFMRLTYDLGRFSQIANLLLRRMRKKNRKVNQNSLHLFLRDYLKPHNRPQKKLNFWEN